MNHETDQDRSGLFYSPLHGQKRSGTNTVSEAEVNTIHSLVPKNCYRASIHWI